MQVQVPFELHGCAADQPGTVTKLAMRLRRDTTVAQILTIVRGRHYRIRPEEALILFMRRPKEDGTQNETMPKMTDTVAELTQGGPVELVVTLESVFG